MTETEVTEDNSVPAASTFSQETTQNCSTVTDSYTQDDPRLSVSESSQTCTSTTETTSDPGIPPTTTQFTQTCVSISGIGIDPSTSEINDTCRLVSGTIDDSIGSKLINPLGMIKQPFFKQVKLY